MSGLISFIVVGVILIIFIILMRLFGAWMLRINDVIDELKGLRTDLKRIENNYLKSKPTNSTSLERHVENFDEYKKGDFKDRLKDLKSQLKVNEIIIVMKDTQELKIISKEQFQLNKKNGVSDKYIVIDKN